MEVEEQLSAEETNDTLTCVLSCDHAGNTYKAACETQPLINASGYRQLGEVAQESQTRSVSEGFHHARRAATKRATDKAQSTKQKIKENAKKLSDQASHFCCTPWDPEWYEDPNASSGETDDEDSDGCELRQRKIVGDMSKQQQMMKVDPYTQDLVISNKSKFPTELLTNFPFIVDNRLLTGFTYDVASGEILTTNTVENPHKDTHDGRARLLSSEMGSEGYACLITTNWWYSQLTFTFVVVALIATGKNANLIFCFCLMNAGYDSPMPIWPRRFVSLAILLLEGFQICVFCKMALREYRSKSNVRESGDLIFDKTLSKAERNVPWAALTVFHIFEVDVLVKDAVKYMHPFKGKQPFAAFKADGHRAFMLGYQDVHSFHASHMQRPYGAVLTQIVIEAMLLIFKVLSAASTRSFSYFVMSLPGLFIIYLKGSGCFERAHHRKCYWRHLRQTCQDGSDKDQKAAQKLMKNVFPVIDFETEELTEGQTLKFQMAAILVALAIVTVVLDTQLF